MTSFVKKKYKNKNNRGIVMPIWSLLNDIHLSEKTAIVIIDFRLSSEYSTRKHWIIYLSTPVIYIIKKHYNI